MHAIQEATIAQDMAGHETLIQHARLEPKLLEIVGHMNENLTCQQAILTDKITSAHMLLENAKVLCTSCLSAPCPAGRQTAYAAAVCCLVQCKLCQLHWLITLGCSCCAG